MKKVVLAVCVLIMTNAYAQILNEEKVNTSDITLSEKGITNASDDITKDQIEKIKLTDKQRHEARVWGLSEEEEKRYIALKDNKSKYFYQGLRHTPIDILGLNARNDEERTKYAYQAAQLELVKVARELAWNSTFSRAVNNLTKGQSVISDFDTRPYSPKSKNSVSLKDNDHLVLFISKNDPALTLVSFLSDGIKHSKNTRLSIYITDADEHAAQLWAGRNDVPILMVSNKQIDLNIGSTLLDSLNIPSKKTPILILERNSSSKLVTLGSLAG